MAENCAIQPSAKKPKKADGIHDRRQLIDLRATRNLLEQQLCQCNHYLTRCAIAPVES